PLQHHLRLPSVARKQITQAMGKLYAASVAGQQSGTAYRSSFSWQTSKAGAIVEICGRLRSADRGDRQHRRAQALEGGAERKTLATPQAEKGHPCGSA